MSENQALLDAIRVIVGEAVTPLNHRMDGFSVRLDGLTQRVDGLTEQVGGLTQRVDGLTEQVGGLTQRVDGLTEQVGGLTQRVDGLTEQVGGLSLRMDRIETEQYVQRGILQGMDQRFTQMDVRLTNLEGVSMRLEHEIGRVETRTGQMSSDISDLLELQDKVNEGFKAFKQDFHKAFIDIGELQDGQKGYRRQIKVLRERVDRLEQRLEKLESSGAAK
jgi:chromosome segregation ATPase